MKSFLVIGAGQFGRHLTNKFIELGDEVLIIDRDEEKVKDMATVATASLVGDCQDESVVESLGVANFDACFVCVREDFQCSLEVTSLLKDFGAKYVVSRADREVQIKFLKKLGADKVIHMERDMADRVAMRYSAKNAFEYFEFSSNYAVFEIGVPKEWVGKSVMELNPRKNYQINIIATKLNHETNLLMDASYRFHEDEHLIIASDTEAGIRIMNKG